MVQDNLILKVNNKEANHPDWLSVSIKAYFPFRINSYKLIE